MGITGILYTLLFFSALVMALVRHPRFGMYAYLAAFYVFPPARWWGAALPDFRWSLVASVVTVIAVWRMPRNPAQVSWFKTMPGKIILWFTVWVWIQNLWALEPVKHLDLSILFTKYIILYYVIYRICDTPKEVAGFLFAHILGCFYLGYLAHGQPVSGRLEGVGGPGIDEANALAMQLATAAMCGAMIVLVDRRWRLACVTVAMAFILNGIVLCGSRGAFLSMIIGGCVLMRIKPDGYRAVFNAFAILGVMLFLVVTNQDFWERMGTMGAAVDDSQQMDASAESRLVVISAQLKMAARYPFGAGHRGTEVLSPQYLDERWMTRSAVGAAPQRSSHNTFMTALVEQGVPGALCYVVLVIWSWRTTSRLRREFGKQWAPAVVGSLAAIAASLMVVLVAGMFVDYLKMEVQIWMFALLAAMLSYTNGRNVERSAAVDTQSMHGRSPVTRASPPGHR